MRWVKLHVRPPRIGEVQPGEDMEKDDSPHLDVLARMCIQGSGVVGLECEAPHTFYVCFVQVPAGQNNLTVCFPSVNT